MFCKNCGKELDAGSNFCNFCGASQVETNTNSTAYNFGKILGTIGALAITNKVVDDLNKKSRDSMRKTAEVGLLNMKKTNLMMQLNGGSISEEEYNRRCYDIDKEIEGLRKS